MLGPYQTFKFAKMDCYLIGPRVDGFVTSWEGVSIKTTKAFDDDRLHLDVLFVPGGADPVQNVIKCGPLGDNPYLDFLTKRAGTKWICSVCSGALFLGAAGLLRDYTCTTHWAFRDVLRKFPGVDVVDDNRRYVRHDNRITGAGISAGIDQSLYVTSVILGLDKARICQLKMQYRPDPVVHCGDPDDTDIRDNPGIVDQVRDEWHVKQAVADVEEWLAKGASPQSPTEKVCDRTGAVHID